MMKTKPILGVVEVLCALILLISLNFSVAASEHDQLVDFLGEWQSDDDAFGQPAMSSLSWKVVLGGKFVRLDYTIIATRNDTQEPMFAGVAYYRELSTKELEAFWADSGGDLLPIKASRSDRLLISNWGEEGGKQGKTHYQLTDDGQLLVTDWIKKADQWQQFNKGHYTRINSVH